MSEYTNVEHPFLEKLILSEMCNFANRNKKDESNNRP